MAKPAAMVILFVLFLISPLMSATGVGPDADIRDLRGPLLPHGFPPFAATATLLLAAGVFFLYRRRKGVLPPPVSEPECEQVTPHDMLALLMEEVRQLPPAEVVERLAPVIRSYLAERIGTTASHLTSEELLAILKSNSGEELLERSGALLHFCDSVRFGGLQPTAVQADRALHETSHLLGNI